MMKPELFIFDLAGTTVHDNRDVHRVLQHVFKEIHLDISIHEANEVMGIPKPEAIKILLQQHSYPDIDERLVNDMHEQFVKNMTEFYRHDYSVREKEGASEIFRQVKSMGAKVVVDTGFDRAIVNPLLERLGWQKKKLIDASVTSDEVKRGRPFPDMVFKAMELTGVKKADAVVKVGDTLSDLQEGSFAGCGWVIGITSGAYSREQLKKGPHTHLIDQLSELAVLFQLKQSVSG
ncbi:phosphatase [Cytophagales bacterium WSM2-2]|nr:phosphatase [Cytophagales bacterium WSM2-2]